jgi:hypothetical protein
MGIILAGLVLTVIIVLVALLVLVRAGIRRQERAGCLACQPPGLGAAMARRMAGLYVSQPGAGGCPAAQAGDESSLVPDSSESPAS